MICSRKEDPGKKAINQLAKNLWNVSVSGGYIGKILEMPRGTNIKKLERMRELIYSYIVEHFEVVKRKKTTPSIPIKSRRQKEIDCLVWERRQLKIQWRKA